MKFSNINLTREALKRISEILSDMGVVVAATAIIPTLMDGFNIPRIIIGSLLVTLFWVFSIKISNTWIQ